MARRIPVLIFCMICQSVFPTYLSYHACKYLHIEHRPERECAALPCNGLVNQTGSTLAFAYCNSIADRKWLPVCLKISKTKNAKMTLNSMWAAVTVMQLSNNPKTRKKQQQKTVLPSAIHYCNELLKNRKPFFTQIISWKSHRSFVLFGRSRCGQSFSSTCSLLIPTHFQINRQFPIWKLAHE